MRGTGIAESDSRPLPVIIVVGIVRLEGGFRSGPESGQVPAAVAAGSAFPCLVTLP